MSYRDAELGPPATSGRLYCHDLRLPFFTANGENPNPEKTPGPLSAQKNGASLVPVWFLFLRAFSAVASARFVLPTIYAGTILPLVSVVYVLYSLRWYKWVITEPRTKSPRGQTRSSLCCPEPTPIAASGYQTRCPPGQPPPCPRPPACPQRARPPAPSAPAARSFWLSSS